MERRIKEAKQQVAEAEERYVRLDRLSLWRGMMGQDSPEIRAWRRRASLQLSLARRRLYWLEEMAGL